MGLSEPGVVFQVRGCVPVLLFSLSKTDPENEHKRIRDFIDLSSSLFVIDFLRGIGQAGNLECVYRDCVL